MAFKAINTGDADLNRVQSNIADALRELAPSLPVRTVLSSATVNQELVASTDRYLIVNSRGGPIKVVLPAPTVKQEVTIKNATTSTNAVDIVQQNGKPTGDGETSIPITGLAAVTMVADGTAWRRLTTGLSSIIPAAEPVPPPSPPLPPAPPPPPSPISGPFWMSRNVGVPFAVDMSLLGTGVLQQTSSGGVATPFAAHLTAGLVQFGGTDQLIAEAGLFLFDPVNIALGVGTATPASTARAHLYDSRAADGNRYWTQPTKLIVENPDATGLSGVMFAGNQGLPSMDTETWFEKTAAILYSSDSYPGPSGGGTMIFSVPQNIGAIQGFSWVASGQRRMTHQLVDSAHNQWRLTEVDGGGDGALGRTGWQMDTGSATPIGEWAVTGSGLTADPAPFDVRNAMVSYYPGGGSMYWATDVTGTPDRSMMLGGGSLFLPTSLGAGGMVYATGAGAGQLALATIGTGLSFSGGTLSATGGTGTVTAVTASSPLASSGGTAPNITHNTSSVVPGTFTFATVIVDSYGHVTGAASGNTSVFVPITRNVNTTAPLTGGGSLNADLTLVLSYDNTSLNTSGGVLQRMALSGDVNAAAGSGATAFRNFTATSVLGRSANSTGAPADIAASADGDVLWRNGTTLGFAALPYSKITGTPTPITWPAAKDILVSTGTSSDPTGEAAFTYDTATNLFRLDGFQGIGVDPGSLGDGKYVLAVYGNASQDRIYMRPGGITLAASGAFKQWELAPLSTALSTNPANALLADAFFAGMTYTGGAGSATVALSTTVYIAGPPTMPYEMEGGLYTLYVAAGISHFVTVEATDLSTSATLGTAGTFAVGGGANLINALGGATQLGFFSATPVGQQTGGSATAGVVYTATEQVMLQKAYDCLRSFGLLS